MADPAISPLLLLPVIGFVLYRRVRSSVGRQRLVRAQVSVRLGFIALAMVVVVLPLLALPGYLLPVLAGLAGGVLLAQWGLRLTRFEWLPDGAFYTPNPYLGSALLVILLGRLLYRLSQMSGGAGAGAGDYAAMLLRSPFTLALLTLLLGYYFAYGLGLLRRKPPLAEAIEAG